MKPHIILHMLSSIDGRLHPSRWTASPDGARSDWSGLYEKTHDALAGDAWMVGRVTMAEMSKAEPHAPAGPVAVPRPVHVAPGDGGGYAIALDRSGKLHFARADLDGDRVIVLLGHDVPESHLAELLADDVSYIVAADAAFDLAALLNTLGEAFGIDRLLLEGGGGINGSLLAAGLVDELSILVAPALDGGKDVQGIVMHDEGLAGSLRLGLISADVMDKGVVHLRYAVLPADG